MTDIFVSHYSGDSKSVQTLTNLIKEVFALNDEHTKHIFNSSDKREYFTQDSIELGDNWFDKILQALTDAKIVLVILTPESLKRFWVNFEIGVTYATIHLLEKDPKIKKKLIPCLLGLNHSDLPENLKLLESVNLQNIDDIHRLLHFIRDAIEHFRASDNTIKMHAATLINVENLWHVASKQIDVDMSPNATIDITREEIISIIKDVNSLPTNRFDQPHIRYLNNYKYGKLLGRLNALDEEVFEFSKIIYQGQTRFKAMKYLVTKRLFQQSSNKNFTPSPPEEIYYPYCLPLEEISKSHLNDWWNENIRPFIEVLERSHNMSLRLPTYDEWLKIAENPEGWHNKILECNVTISQAETRELCAVGCFPNNISDVGCFDVIGNAWELCLENTNTVYPTYIVGWSYMQGDYQNHPNWWKTKIELGTVLLNKNLPVSFRLIQELRT